MVRRDVRQQDTDARPAAEDRLPSPDGYGTVLPAGSVRNVRAPMIMTTFTEALGLRLRSRTVHPVTTHTMSGLGTTERDYAASCPGAGIAEGLAVRGEKVKDAGPATEERPQRTGLTRARPGRHRPRTSPPGGSTAGKRVSRPCRRP
ncbi:hypothetical protein QFZ75_007630 [Streptomyces sp. V3I8]|uniref:flavodoxin n=1 Tax=Streptomyces sp. V3I8 TaxID=3042279 RepID=UPI00277D3BD1|nr:hypothetical protein [Streptomyces sp. V3I8]